MDELNIGNVKSLWLKKYTGKTLSIFKKNVGKFEVRFNPVRANYMATTQHATIDTDVFCHQWNHIVEHEQIGYVTLPHFSWIVAINTSPIEEYHSLLICAEHQEQTLNRDSFEDFYDFSSNNPQISVGFNSWNAGASQNHLHAQLFFSALPILQWKSVKEANVLIDYPGLCMSFLNPLKAYEVIEELTTLHIPYNALFTGGIIFLIPRKNQDDSKNVKRGFDSVFGKIPLLTQQDYDDVTLANVDEIFNSLTYKSLTLGNNYVSV